MLEFNCSGLNHRLVVVGDVHRPENDVAAFYSELFGFNHGAVCQREPGIAQGFYFGYGQPFGVGFVGTAGSDGAFV